mgnify:FL=1
MRLEGSSEAGTGWAGRCLSTTFALALHGAVVIAVAVWQNLSFKPPPPPVYFEIISEVAYQSLFPTPEPEPTLDPEPELELEPEPEPEPEPESEVESEPEPEQFLPESTNPAIVAMETPPSKPTPPQIEPTPRQVEPRMHVKVINVNSSPASYNPPLPLPSAAPLYTPPNGQAAYLHNPKPIYPRQARQRGMEGVVFLRVEVASKGHPLAIIIMKSSGFSVLDRAAIQAVGKWRFIPATKNGISVTASVEVPVRFQLADG